jgi:type II secretory pathway pseudopilin PulG
MTPPLRIPRRTAALRRGFTLVEAIISMSVMAVAGVTVLVGISSALQSTDKAVQQQIADGMARQLIDEIAGKLYSAAGTGPYTTTLGPNSVELAGPGRSLFDDIDDFHNFRAQRPEDPRGQALGSEDDFGGSRHTSFRVPSAMLADLRQEIDVYYVSDSDQSAALSGSQTSNSRAVEVRIYVVDSHDGKRLLTRVRHVFSYFPEM